MAGFVSRNGWVLAFFSGWLLNSATALHAGERDELSGALKKAIALQKESNHAGAARQFERALALAPRVFGPDALDTAAILDSLAMQYQAMGQYSQAEPLFQRSLKIREAKLGPDDLRVADSLNYLALLCMTMGQYSKAEPLFQRILKIRESKLGPNDPLVAESIESLALPYMSMGQFSQAKPLYQRSLKIKEAKLGADHVDVAETLAILAFLYGTTAHYAQAEPLLKRSLKIREAKLGPEHPLVAESLRILAALSERMGQYAKAEPLYQRSLKISQVNLGPDHIDVASSLDGLAALYLRMGQYAKAERLYQRSLKICEAQRGPDHLDLAASLSNLAVLYVDMGEYAKAEPLQQRSLKIREAELGSEHLDVASSLNNLASLYSTMGQYAKAEPLYQRSVTIREAKLPPDHPEVAEGLNNLANHYLRTGQYGQAEPLYQRSLKIKEAKLGSDHPEVAGTLNNLSVLHKAIGRDDKAATEIDRARRIVRRHVARVLPVLSAREQLTFIESTDEARFHAALSLGRLHRDDPRLAEQSASWLINGKAVIQESLAEQTLLARDSHDPRVASQIEKLQAVRTELAGLSMVVPKPGQEASRRKRLAELSVEEQELSRLVNLAADRPTQDDPWVESAAVRKALAQDAVLIDIIRLWPRNLRAKHSECQWEPARYVAWLVPLAGRGNVRIIDLGGADQIDQAVETALKAIEHSALRIQRSGDDEKAPESAALESLTVLAKLVLEPLLPALADARELVLSPDSQLWLVPWAALPMKERQYAIERWRLRFVTSGREVVLASSSGAGANQPKPTRPRIFADPDYDLDGRACEATTRAVLRGREKQLALRASAGRSESGLSRAERLPATAEEARLIAPALESLAHEAPTVFEGKYALEGALKVIASPRVLVLSTHGFYLPDQEAKPDDDRASRHASDSEQRRGALLTSEGTPLENPLLRCGLLLAGCNQRQRMAVVDDGVVTGMEIVGCDLRGTELVVLSTCETGLGQVRNGEGVAGLRQAFQLAGAKAVVSTLWRIPDEETVWLMSDFFSQLAAGQSKAEALRNAQLAQIKTRRHATGAAHPYYWAAFTVTGN